MREIFLRSYISILLTLLLSAAIGVAGVHLYNQLRFGQLAEYMLTGPMTLLAQNYASLSSEQRQTYQAQLRLFIPVPLRFDSTEQANGIEVDHIWFRDRATIRAHANGAVVEADIEGFDQLAARLSVLLIVTDMIRTPADEREQRFSELQALMHYPLELKALEQVQLDDSEKYELSRNNVLVRQSLHNGKRSTTAIATPTDQLALIYGPIPTFVAMPIGLVASLLLLLILAIALGTWPALLPLQNRLQRMADSVRMIDQGQMNHRLPTERSDALDEMATAINDLADGLIGAIDSQRTLVHAVSHELKTPLARMQFRLATIEGQVSDGAFDGLSRDLDSLSQLINELLDFGRDELTQTTVQPETVELHQLVDQVWQQQNLEGKAIDWGNEVPKPSYVEVDRNLACKLLSNLLSNAIRFCTGKVTVSFNEDTMMLTVCDDGPGIPVDQRNKVLQPFFRLDPSRQRGTGGHGLGLSIAHRIARWHQGDLWFETSPWQGAKAVWLIPDRMERQP